MSGRAETDAAHLLELRLGRAGDVAPSKRAVPSPYPRLWLTMIFVTHDLRLAGTICDRVAVMQKGKLVELGTVEQVFPRPQQDYTRNLLAAAPGLELEGLG